MKAKFRCKICYEGDFFKLTSKEIKKRLATDKANFLDELTYFFHYRYPHPSNRIVIDKSCFWSLLYPLGLLVCGICFFNGLTELLLMAFILLFMILYAWAEDPVLGFLNNARDRRRMKSKNLEKIRRSPNFDSAVKKKIEEIRVKEIKDIKLQFSNIENRKNTYGDDGTIFDRFEKQRDRLRQLDEKYRLIEEFLIKR